jgi:hypothetical protein
VGIDFSRLLKLAAKEKGKALEIPPSLASFFSVLRTRKTLVLRILAHAAGVIPRE